MKLTQAELHVGGKEERKEFSRFKTLGESLRKGALVAAVAVAASFGVACGPSGPTSDGGTGGDGGSVVTDGGHDSGDGGSASGLCDMYQHGDIHRVDLSAGAIVRPGDNHEGWLMYFKSIKIQSDGTWATVGIYPDTLSSSVQYYGFQNGQTKTVPVPGSTGDVQMQVCGMSALECDVAQPGGTVTGDSGCYVTIAADKPFGF